MRCLVIGVLVAAIAASPASAAIIAFWRLNPITPAAIANDPNLANMWSLSLMVQTDGNWATAGLRVTLSPGNTFYHSPFGGNTRPNQGLIPSLPALAYDTYVSSPADTGAAGGQVPAILGGHPASPTADFGGTTGIFSVSWGDTFVDPPGVYEIARLTWPQGVFADVYYGSPPTLPNASNTSQVSPADAVLIPQIFPPEPTAIGMGAWVGFLAIRRCRTRRRRIIVGSHKGGNSCAT